MTLGIVDLKNFDITIASLQFGTISLRNYGENGVSAQIASPDTKLYNEKMGAYGDALLNKNYKAGRNKLLTIQMLRNSPDYARLQNIIAAEEAGQSIICAVTCRDSLTKESYSTPGGVFMDVPAFEQGSDVDADVEYTFFMPNCVHVPPKLDLNVTAGV
jgi:hypothetical protein